MQDQTITQTIRIIYDGGLASTGSSLLTPAVVAAVLIVIGLLSGFILQGALIDMTCIA